MSAPAAGPTEPATAVAIVVVETTGAEDRPHPTRRDGPCRRKGETPAGRTTVQDYTDSRRR